MGKRQDWSVTACVFLFLSLASQIHCTNQTNVSRPMLGVGSSGDARQNNVLPGVLSPKENDLIKELPGQPSDVSFRQYGGYVAVNETAGRFLYYYLVEAIKPSNSTPLVIWFNGGPGCSSLNGGAFQEVGPFRVHNDNTLFLNPYSWNNVANVLFLETPAGVGFSYSNTEDAKKIGEQGDTLTVEDNHVFLVNWLERFPEYKGREIYIAGQSYAGHYGPQLAQIILRRNNQSFINLRGMIIGNPALEGTSLNEHTQQYLVAHGILSQDIVDNMNKFCNNVGENYEQFQLEKCTDWRHKVDYHQNLDLYNIYTPVCISTSSSKPKNCTTVMDVDPCQESYVNAYLNMKNVQEAMHANTTKLPYPWTKCSKALNTHWNETQKEEDSMIPVLHELMGKGLRMMIYSGDMDSVVPFSATLATLKAMNLTIVNEWRSWFTEGEVGGYTVDYKGNLSFATVRGAGHSVPKDQPIRAFTLFTNFIRNTPLPKTS